MTSGSASISTDFNPRSHEGSDKVIGQVPACSNGFQSTLPRGERPSSNTAPSCSRYFNPRSHEGSDYDAYANTTTTPEFQSTLPRGERPVGCPGAFGVSRISIHAPTRGATQADDRADQVGEFQSTLPRGERPRAALAAVVKELFQSTLPRGERLIAPTRGGQQNNDFNPRSHEGSDHVAGLHRDTHAHISIHAPTRGATQTAPWRVAPDDFNPRSHEGSDQLESGRGRIIGISIHAPTRGATQTASFTRLSSLAFQSTLPRGERLAPLDEVRHDLGISIHAPTRGATVLQIVVAHFQLISIHAPTRGATLGRLLSPLTMELFQSTLPRGERRWPHSTRSVTISAFQSTLPRGERPSMDCSVWCGPGISIHAPTRGATKLSPEKFVSAMYFNPRSHEGSD